MSEELGDSDGEQWIAEAVVANMVRQLTVVANDFGYLVRRVASRGGKTIGVSVKDIGDEDGSYDWDAIAAELMTSLGRVVDNIDALTIGMETDIFSKGGIIAEERMRVRDMSQMVLDMYAYGKAGLIEHPTERLSHRLNNMVNAAAANLVYLQNPDDTGIKPDEIPF